MAWSDPVGKTSWTGGSRKYASPGSAVSSGSAPSSSVVSTPKSVSNGSSGGGGGRSSSSPVVHTYRDNSGNVYTVTEGAPSQSSSGVVSTPTGGMSTAYAAGGGYSAINPSPFARAMNAPSTGVVSTPTGGVSNPYAATGTPGQGAVVSRSSIVTKHEGAWVGKGEVSTTTTYSNVSPLQAMFLTGSPVPVPNQSPASRSASVYGSQISSVTFTDKREVPTKASTFYGGVLDKVNYVGSGVVKGAIPGAENLEKIPSYVNKAYVTSGGFVQKRFGLSNNPAATTPVAMASETASGAISWTVNRPVSAAALYAVGAGVGVGATALPRWLGAGADIAATGIKLGEYAGIGLFGVNAYSGLKAGRYRETGAELAQGAAFGLGWGAGRSAFEGAYGRREYGYGLEVNKLPVGESADLKTFNWGVVRKSTGEAVIGFAPGKGFYAGKYPVEKVDFSKLSPLSVEEPLGPGKTWFQENLQRNAYASKYKDVPGYEASGFVGGGSPRVSGSEFAKSFGELQRESYYGYNPIPKRPVAVETRSASPLVLQSVVDRGLFDGGTLYGSSSGATFLSEKGVSRLGSLKGVEPGKPLSSDWDLMYMKSTVKVAPISKDVAGVADWTAFMGGERRFYKISDAQPLLVEFGGKTVKGKRLGVDGHAFDIHSKDMPIQPGDKLFSQEGVFGLGFGVGKAKKGIYGGRRMNLNPLADELLRTSTFGYSEKGVGFQPKRAKDAAKIVAYFEDVKINKGFSASQEANFGRVRTFLEERGLKASDVTGARRGLVDTGRSPFSVASGSSFSPKSFSGGGLSSHSRSKSFGSSSVRSFLGSSSGSARSGSSHFSPSPVSPSPPSPPSPFSPSVPSFSPPSRSPLSPPSPSMSFSFSPSPSPVPSFSGKPLFGGLPGASLGVGRGWGGVGGGVRGYRYAPSLTAVFKGFRGKKGGRGAVGVSPFNIRGI